MTALRAELPWKILNRTMHFDDQKRGQFKKHILILLPGQKSPCHSD